jgi:hypothetical protein
VAMAVPLVAGQPKFNEAKERTKFQQLSPETLYTNHTTMKHQRHNTTVIIINFSETINKKKKKKSKKSEIYPRYFKSFKLNWVTKNVSAAACPTSLPNDWRLELDSEDSEFSLVIRRHRCW